MCGICGVLHYGGTPRFERQVADMTLALRHRGPDDQQTWADACLSLGHTRLSIIDLSERGRQPMTTPGGRYTLVYNGELYNYRSLRRELQALGVDFRSDSDTEVVLHALVHWGADAIQRFNGMYAIAFWDAVEQELVLARDRFGIKPLYWSKGQYGFAFASEIKSLLVAGFVDRRIESAGLHEYLYFGNALGAKTMFRGVYRLPPDSLLICRRGREPQVHAVPRRTLPLDQALSFAEASERVRTELGAAVERHLLADVPVALLLSGGLDSSTIAAVARKQGANPTTISIGFEGTGPDELPEARSLASSLGTAHLEYVLRYEALEETLMALVRAHDQPFGDAANVPLFLIAKELSGTFKVLLQGDGGDEIFGGYRRYAMLRYVPYLQILSRVQKVPLKWARNSTSWRRIRRLQDAFAETEEPMRMARLLTQEWAAGGVEGVLSADVRRELSSNDPFSRYRAIHAQLPAADPVQMQLAVDTKILLPDIFLEKVDRATMAHGVEVRVPMLDSALADLVTQLPSSFKVRRRMTKRILRSAMQEDLPSDVLNRSKRGFGVPYREWLRGPLRNMLMDQLFASRSEIGDMLDKESLRRLVQQHLAGEQDHGFMLYKLLMLALWGNAYLRDSAGNG